MKQRENEWNSCFDGILNLFFFLSSGLWDHITRQQTIFTGFRVTCSATSGSRGSWGTLQHDLWSARAAHTVSALPSILRCGLRVQMGRCRRPLGEKNVDAFPHSRRQKRCLISIPKDAADKAEFGKSSDTRCGTPTRLLQHLKLRV